MIESECRSPERETASEWSVPSIRIVVEFVSSEPLSGARTLVTVAGSRLFASETPPRNVR